MIAAVISEYRKFFSTRMWWVLTLSMFAYFLLIAGGMGYMLAHEAQNGGLPPELIDSYRTAVYGLGPSMGYVFPALIGAMAVTAEYRHSTILPTFLGEPRRAVVMAAKAVAAVPMGFVVGLAGTLACLAGGAIGLEIAGVGAQLGAGATWRGLALSVLAMTLWALVGVGLGMLVISQVGVIIPVLVFPQLVEPLARLGLAAFPATAPSAKYLPGAASDAITGGGSIYAMAGLGGAGAYLRVWQGALVLAAYGVVFGLIGYFLRIRRDVA